MRRHWARIAAAAAVLLMPVAGHYAIRCSARPTLPRVAIREQPVTQTRGVRSAGTSYVRHRGSILEVRLQGSAEEIGNAHARLLREEMVETESAVWRVFERRVPSSLMRTAVMDLAIFRYRNVDEGFDPARRTEIAAQALAFDPDPFRSELDTYQRFLYLNALYDISLSFEKSPLIGCTTFVVSGEAVEGGDTLLGRTFDFEADPIFDVRKTVFLVLEHGAIPFASVAWPGLVGVVSGMNAEGVAVVVHGARAGQPRASGEPVVHALRRVLATAHSTRDAIAALEEREPMVSHIVVVADASGKSVAVERIPGEAPYVRELGSRAVVTNHLLGPSSRDPKNQEVLAKTSTLARLERGRELLRSMRHRVDVTDVVAFLRDRRGRGGAALARGDRRAIDALIATHGVVMNAASREIWVSEAPHLLGRFVQFDLKRLLTPGSVPSVDARPAPAVRADPLLTSGEYGGAQQRPKAAVP